MRVRSLFGALIKLLDDNHLFSCLSPLKNNGDLEDTRIDCGATGRIDEWANLHGRPMESRDMIQYEKRADPKGMSSELPSVMKVLMRRTFPGL